MPTNATDRELIAQKIMRKGIGAVAIANPFGADVDAILVKPANYHAPGAPTTVVVWFQDTGDNMAANYGV